MSLICGRGHRLWLLAALLSMPEVVMSCSNTKKDGCPELASIIHGNPIEDAQQAFAAGDHRLLSIGGFVGTTPGGGSEDMPSREMPGTSDTASAACRAHSADAVMYATSYNKTMLSLLKRTN